MSGDHPSLRVYRALVRLYPREFRDTYCDDMVQLLRDQATEEPPWRVAGRAMVDLAITIPSQHMEARMNRPPTHLVPVLYTVLAVSGLLMAAVGGTSTAPLVIGLSIAVVAGGLATIAWRRSRSVAARSSTHTWWKLVLAGPGIVVAVVVAARLGATAWMAGMFAVFVAVVVTAAGVVLGVAQLVHRHSHSTPA